MLTSDFQLFLLCLQKNKFMPCEVQLRRTIGSHPIRNTSMLAFNIPFSLAYLEILKNIIKMSEVCKPKLHGTKILWPWKNDPSNQIKMPKITLIYFFPYKSVKLLFHLNLTLNFMHTQASFQGLDKMKLWKNWEFQISAMEIWPHIFSILFLQPRKLKKKNFELLINGRWCLAKKMVESSFGGKVWYQVRHFLTKHYQLKLTEFYSCENRLPNTQTGPQIISPSKSTVN